MWCPYDDHFTPVKKTEDDKASLTVVLPGILELEVRPGKYLGASRKVQPAVDERDRPLGGVELDFHAFLL